MSPREVVGIVCMSIVLIAVAVFTVAVIWYMLNTDPVLAYVLIASLVLLAGMLWGLS